jgi:superfamily I DNA and/or RNA helicase
MLQARSYIFQLKHFSLCIVDEASQILEPGLVGLLASQQIDRFILVGDHKQLPAVVQQTEQESAVDNPLLTAIGITNCRQSLFERLLRWEHQCGRTQFIGVLRKQGRMHPDIAAFPNEMFYHRERLEPVPLEHQTDTSLHYDLPSEDAADELLKHHRVLFFDVKSADTSELTDKSNPAEARVVADLLRRIYRFYGARFDASKTVGVIVPYRNQIAAIRSEIERLGIAALADISIDTVERYQGSQRDVIVYSFTVSRPYQLDFLTSNCFVDEDGQTVDRKLNVAITRARKQLLMTGNQNILMQNSIFARLIERYKKKMY